LNQEVKRLARFGYLFAFLAAVMFGMVSTIAKPVVSSVDPLLLASLVYLVSAATLTPIAQKSKFQFPKRKDLVLLLAVSLSGAVIAPSLFFVGLQHASASDAAILSNGEVIFTVLLAMLFFKEKVRPIGYIAIMMVLVGMFIVTTDLNFSTSLSQIHPQDMMIILAMGFWAVDNNLSRILAQRIKIARIVQIKSVIGGTLLFTIAVFGFKIPIDIDSSHILSILLLGTMGFAVSLYFFLEALKRISTVKTIMIFSFASVFGLIAANIFLSESISAYQVGAVGIMLIGIYLLNRNES
jgi:drug/metabolite transporter (DMT)-like permease